MGSSASKIAQQAPTLNQAANELSVYDTAKAPWTTEDRKVTRGILMAEKGLASTKPVTFIEFFKQAVAKVGDKPALGLEVPCPDLDHKNDDAPWKFWTYQQYYDECCLAAKAFIALGLQPHDGVNIFGFNAPEWFMGEIGAMFAGGIAAGIYPSDTPEQVQFKSHHSASSIAVVESAKQAATFRKLAEAGRLPNLKAIIVWDNSAPFESKMDGAVKEVHWSKLAEVAKDVTDAALAERMDAVKPDTVCCYIYTSGTTGSPKAVMVTHDSLTFLSAALLGHIAPVGQKAEQERIMSYLPLSHVAGMLVDIVFPIAVSVETSAWCTVQFARPYDLKVGTIVNRLRAVKPTVFLGVPRVWEKIMEKMRAVGKTTKGLKRTMADFGKKKGLAYSQACQMGGSGKLPGNYGIAKQVLDKVAAAIGLGELKMAITGAAPITVECLEFFGALGISINEVYGMSESTGATTWSSNSAHVWGSCGWGVAGTEIKAFRFDGTTKIEVPPAKDLFHPTEEEQGELCFRGRHIMAGYMANPEMGEAHVKEIKKKNEEAIDSEGWLHSGDKGAIDARGMVRITGRYKELIITAGGENVAPVPIEDNIKALCPAVSNVMMIGDKQKFNICVLTLKCDGATGELAGTDQLIGPAAAIDPAAKTISQAMDSKLFIEEITKAITATNKDGNVCPSNASTIQKFSILPIDFSVETGELTATLKLKRSVAEEKYKDLIEKVYASNETFVKYDGPNPYYRASTVPMLEPDAADHELAQAAEEQAEEDRKSGHD